MKQIALLKTGICNIGYDICANKDKFSNKIVIEKEKIFYQEIKRGGFTPLELSFKTYIL